MSCHSFLSQDLCTPNCQGSSPCSSLRKNGMLIPSRVLFLNHQSPLTWRHVASEIVFSVIGKRNVSDANIMSIEPLCKSLGNSIDILPIDPICKSLSNSIVIGITSETKLFPSCFPKLFLKFWDDFKDIGVVFPHGC